MPSRRVVLWDFDGTLAHRPGMWSRALVDVALEQDPTCPLTVEDVRPFLRAGFPWHRPDQSHVHLATPQDWWAEVERILAQAYIGVGYAPAAAARLAVLAHHRYVDAGGWMLFADTLPALASLEALDWEHAILSNHVPELPQLVSSLGLAPHVSAVFSSALTGYDKPHPMAFQTALEHLGDPAVVWMVGDSIEADVLGAERAGVPAILVRQVDPRASRVCADLTGVAALLSQ